LNRLFKEHNIPSEIYYQIKTSITNQESTKDMTDIKDFLDDLPYRLRIRTTMYLYRDAYENVEFLNNEKSENFLAWICPLLTQIFIPMDQYVYYETDLIHEVYF
jgi:hypothetical protein